MSISASKTLRWCIPGLDDELGEIQPGTLIVLLGHPGAGKTTLVSKIVTCNIEKQCIKVVYFSTSETKEKYFTYMENLGLKLREFENKGSLKFIELPTFSGEMACDVFIDVLTRTVAEEDPDLIVIDSVTPILWYLKDDPSRRSFLHAGIYKVVSELHKTMILVGDLPYGKERVDLGGIEFVADVVLVAKLLSERGKPTRRLEIRKFRGRNVKVSEFPFAIVEGPGIKIVKPPHTWSPKEHKVRSKLTLLEDDPLSRAIGPIFRGEQILVTYPIGSGVPLRFAVMTARRAIRNKLKLLVITSSSSAELISSYIYSALVALGECCSKEEFSKYVKVHVQDLFSMSVTELMGRTLAVSEEYDPDIVLVLDVTVERDVLWQDMELFNQMNYVFVTIDRYNGIVTFRLLGIHGDDFRDAGLLAEMSDVVIQVAQQSCCEYSMRVIKNPFRKPSPSAIQELEKELNSIVPQEEKFLQSLLEAGKIKLQR